MRRQPILDRQPAGKRRVLGGLLGAARTGAGSDLVGDGPSVEPQAHRMPAGRAAACVPRADQALHALPARGANGFPATAGGHDAAGVPGHVVASAITSLPGMPFAGGCRPSQVGRKIRRA